MEENIDKMVVYAALLNVGLPAAYDLVNDAMFVINTDGQIVYCNRAATTLFGYAIPEMVGAQIEVLVPEASREKHQVHRTGFIDHPDPRQMGQRQEINGRHKNGSEFRVRVALSYVNTATGIFPVAQVRRADHE